VHYRFGEIFLCHTSYYAHLRSPWSRHVTSAAAFFFKAGWTLQALRLKPPGGQGVEKKHLPLMTMTETYYYPEG
jgi:hypothetical protein